MSQQPAVSLHYLFFLDDSLIILSLIIIYENMHKQIYSLFTIILI